MAWDAFQCELRGQQRSWAIAGDESWQDNVFSKVRVSDRKSGQEYFGEVTAN
jgi:hypothetical protein